MTAWRELYKTAQKQLEQAQEALRTAHQTRLSSQEKKEAERKEREALHQKDLLCNNVRNKDDTDFYPYRYLACEGFLPGYNFPRLPVRTYISSGGDGGEYLSRPRFLAVTEYGPRNVIYHEGRKYRVIRSLVPAGDVESRFIQAKLCQNCGTFYIGDALEVDVCEHCKSALDADNSEYIRNLFEMTTVGTQRIERISCDEEERIRYGYEITSHYRLSSEDGRERKLTAEVRDSDGNPLLTLTYGPASELWRINRRWKRNRTPGYNLDLNLGLWNKKPGDTEDTALDVGAENIRSGVQIFVRETKNILLVQPSVNNPLSEEELANLQHSLQKGLCALFQIDETEIASERIGQGTYRSILFWEAAEGGLGVLKRLVEETDVMSRIAGHGLEICHFDKESGAEIEPDVECVRACYHCLLTYRNQPDHAILNRHLIKDFLLRIYGGITNLSYAGRNYDDHYEWLRQQTDNRSQLEKDFLDHLYREGRRLPDEAQMLVPNYPARPDFYYKDGYVCVFCDGSVHDDPRQQEEDQRIRTDLMNRGYRAVAIRYDRPISEQVEENQDIFGVVKS
ncbi:MAG TPA: DUF1998 domain-containing protein [archaeon]|nr:DUF1998 domain-containing protein [archaeon]